MSEVPKPLEHSPFAARGWSDIGAEVRRLRKAKGWSQEKLGGLVGLTQGQVCLCEKGVRPWPGGSLPRVMRVLAP